MAAGRRGKLCGLTVLMLAAGATAAAAADDSAASDSDALPLTVLNVLDTHFQTQETKARGAPAAAELFNDLDLSSSLFWSSWLQINSDLRLERNAYDNLDDYYPHGNAFLRSEGLTLRQLYAAIDQDDWKVWAGKFHTQFGPGYRSTYNGLQGIFYSFGWDYDQDERDGAGIEAKLPEAFGDARIAARPSSSTTASSRIRCSRGPASTTPSPTACASIRSTRTCRPTPATSIPTRWRCTAAPSPASTASSIRSPIPARAYARTTPGPSTACRRAPPTIRPAAAFR